MKPVTPLLLLTHATMKMKFDWLRAYVSQLANWTECTTSVLVWCPLYVGRGVVEGQWRTHARRVRTQARGLPPIGA